MGWESYEIGSPDRASANTISWGPGRRPPKGDPVYSAEPVVVRLIDTNSTAVLINNASTEAVIVNMTIPALSLSSTGGVRLTASGFAINTAVASGKATFRVKMNDGVSQTILASSGLDCSTGDNPRRWQVEVIVQGKQPGFQRNWGFLHLSAPSGNTLAPVGSQVVGYSTSTRDETNEITLTVTAQLSAASTGFRLAREAAFLEGIA